MFDPKCYDLAVEFLADQPSLDSEANRELLAQAIQDTIEGVIEDMKD